MVDFYPAALGLAALLILMISTFSNSTNRNVLLTRLRLRQRDDTESSTRPRKRDAADASGESASPTYEAVFPPPRRHVLGQLPDEAMKGPGMSAKDLGTEPPVYSKCVPDKEVCNSNSSGDYVTPTGFTIDEIRRLGDFPDYATLSGVPLPSPYQNFNINTAVARPYRPLRWSYHQTMSLTKLETDFWLELEQSYVERIKQRQELYAKHGPLIIQTLQGSEIATKELMEMCIQFLCARYPMHFRLDRESMTFHNGLLNNSTDLNTTAPMMVLLNNVPDDFAIMLRDPDTGTYSFRSGMICSALGWSLGSKIGLKLHEIHGPVPHYKEKMQFSMDRYFAKIPTDKPIQRGSWGLEIDEPLFMPPGDPHEKLRDAQDPDHTIDRCRFRVDWQTLRRLPLSGAVVFTFKALFSPVTGFREEAYVPSLLLKVVKEGDEGIMKYKSTWHTEHVVLPELERYEREQIAKGMVDKDWQPHTLDESPFFPGWEEKWHREQGFGGP